MAYDNYYKNKSHNKTVLVYCMVVNNTTKKIINLPFHSNQNAPSTTQSCVNILTIISLKRNIFSITVADRRKSTSTNLAHDYKCFYDTCCIKLLIYPLEFMVLKIDRYLS